ncbi:MULTISPECIES: DUF6479 family protein [unclassified Streptomyces]|uniref:DUF6479 family protein n=1 Tax=unclassified Streptomyces TaxID=2593676 RepID=UPI0033A30641
MNDATLAMPTAASYAGSLWLLVAGISLVVILIAAFFIGTRHSARRRTSTTAPQAAQARREVADPARRGDGWSTPDDDPEQGHPHR